MPASISINMPMKSYLVKFLTKKYGPSHKVSQSGLLGSYLTQLLSKDYKPNSLKVSESSFFTISFPKTIIEKHGFMITTEKMKRFEEFLKQLFRHSLDVYINITIAKGLVVDSGNSMYEQDVMKAMKQFLDMYGITEDELKLDSLYRDYSRTRSKLGQQLAS